ncbi:triose-phosphate transporter family-domain-containing protein [Xylaria bambusicola]|uniref:triose-phosphate transporter family-domain-containing protein n=1 Tax=Xylaria bambusicola TaxID=326684 RepID=UPI0020087A12|nr:triose-phosphate transporter family-domain-containing protein [Xylaria bambusicola]KAI0506560.1 triose-phosphate transporter family-domain-containing protein [Xylaria bambusicola]
MGSPNEERKLEGGVAQVPPPTQNIHPAFYIALWIALSSSVILFNKWVLFTAKFALFLTTWHMAFATLMTQLMAKFTTTLDSRHKVPMNANTYIKAIVPIGIMFSLSLIFGNFAYLYLSVSFIQMLKATNAVATLLATWAFGMAAPNLNKLVNVSAIVIGVAIASFGELKFDGLGFIIQVTGIVCEALRLVMVQRLLSSDEFKMDPLVSVYYYAPACAVINGFFTILIELPRMTTGDILNVGLITLIANAFVAFLLNVSVVLLIGKTNAVVLTMSGVLKDILLVVASMVIFGDPVTLQQYFGYSIALAGLVYYKLGAEKLQQMTTDAKLTINEVRRSNPAGFKLGLICSGLFFVAFIFMSWSKGLPGSSLPTPAA